MERTCEHCGASLDGHRKDARFCGDLCRVRAWMTDHPRVPLQRLVRRAPPARRHSRDGLGTKLYVTPSELREVADRFTAEPGSTALHRKIEAAMERVR